MEPTPLRCTSLIYEKFVLLFNQHKQLNKILSEKSNLTSQEILNLKEQITLSIEPPQTFWGKIQSIFRENIPFLRTNQEQVCNFLIQKLVEKNPHDEDKAQVTANECFTLMAAIKKAQQQVEDEVQRQMMEINEFTTVG